MVRIKENKYYLGELLPNYTRELIKIKGNVKTHIDNITNPPVNKDIIFFVDDCDMSILGNGLFGETFHSFLYKNDGRVYDLGLRCLDDKMIDIKIHDEYIEILDRDYDDPCTLKEHGYDSDIVGDLDNKCNFTIIRVEGKDRILFNKEYGGKSVCITNDGFDVVKYHSTLHMFIKLMDEHLYGDKM